MACEENAGYILVYGCKHGVSTIDENSIFKDSSNAVCWKLHALVTSNMDPGHWNIENLLEGPQSVTEALLAHKLAKLPSVTIVQCTLSAICYINLFSLAKTYKFASETCFVLLCTLATLLL